MASVRVCAWPAPPAAMQAVSTVASAKAARRPDRTVPLSACQIGHENEMVRHKTT